MMDLLPQRFYRKVLLLLSLLIIILNICTSITEAKNERSRQSLFTINDKSDSHLKSQCMTDFGYRTFLSNNSKNIDENFLPPIFYTIPGAGNTWVRLLIEYSTGK